MSTGQASQLESVMDEVLKGGNVQALKEFIERHSEESPMLCSQNFSAKLYDLVKKGFDENNAKAASLGLASLHKFGKNLKLQGVHGLSSLINQGLVKKWFERCRQLWIQYGPHRDETLLELAENFLNALMVVHEASKEGTMKVTEFFLYPVGYLALDPRIYILIQKEAIRKYNLLLDKIPVELKKNRKILTSQEASDMMGKLADRIMDGGDYDLQSSVMEALCRMATPDQRRKLADQWFRMGHVAKGFTQIRDSEFETACRKFLNMVNGMQGDKRRVYSYPCLEVYLGKYELLMPSDEKLEEFWIDFNLDSRSISFYCSLPEEEEGHWETISITENEVLRYTVTDKNKRQILEVKMSEVVVVGEVEGSSLTIYFSHGLDILEAARNVYGEIAKKRPSVSKTAIQTASQASNSQVVPESQVSLGESETNTAPYLSRPPAGDAQMVTPSRIKMSESTSIVSTSERGSVKNSCSLMFRMSAKEKRSSAQKVSSCESTAKSTTGASALKEMKTPVIQLARALASHPSGEKTPDDFVPETQHKVGLNISSVQSKSSISDFLMMSTQKVCSMPKGELQSVATEELERSTSSIQKFSVSHSGLTIQKQFHSELTLRLQQVHRERSKNSSLQGPAVTARQKKVPVTSEDSKDRSSGNLEDVSFCIPIVEKTKWNKHPKEEVKSSLPAQAQISSAETTAKSSKTMKTQKSLKVKNNTKKNFSDKEKTNAEVTGNMVKLISSHYETNSRPSRKEPLEMKTQKWTAPLVSRPVFNMNWLSKDKGKLPGALSFTKTNKKLPANSPGPRKDVFEFTLDSPISTKRAKKTSAKTSDVLNNRINNSPALVSTTKKAKAATKNKRNAKKHLFSDTEVENTTTEVSWLRESSRKPKPRVNQYNRQAVKEPKAKPSLSTSDSPDFFPSTLNTIAVNNKSRKNPVAKTPLDQPQEAPNPTKGQEVAAPSMKLCAPGKRPRRVAALSKKSYKEPDSDDSQSETEKHPAPKIHCNVLMEKNMNLDAELPRAKKGANTFCDRVRRNSNSRSDSTNQQGLKTSELHKNTPLNQAQRKGFRGSLLSCKNSSIPAIEKMRSAEGSAATLTLPRSTLLSPRGSPLPAFPPSPCRGTPSPVQLVHRPSSAVSCKGKRKESSFYSSERRSTKTHLTKPDPCPTSCEHEIHAPVAAKGSSVQQQLSPTQFSSFPSAQPLLTSTQLDLEKPADVSNPPSSFLEDTLDPHLDFKKLSVDSLASLSQLSTNSSKFSIGSIKKSSPSSEPVANAKEKTPTTDRDLETTEHLISGPNRKRHTPMSSDSEEEERNRFGKEEKKKSKIRQQRSPRIKPRKLFKSFAEPPVAEPSVSDKMSVAVSSSHMYSSTCRSDLGDVDMDIDDTLDTPDISVNHMNVYRNLSSKLKDKLQNRCKVLEFHTKQTSKTVKQHMSSIGVELTKDRTQRLEHIQNVLQEEIHKMEQDDNMLRTMEKELTIHWKKQTVAFKNYYKQETRRTEILKQTLQTDTCSRLEIEEQIFTSEMCLIRKDMRSAQDRLLSDMLEGEVQSVKKGLHALFFQGWS